MRYPYPGEDEVRALVVKHYPGVTYLIRENAISEFLAMLVIAQAEADVVGRRKELRVVTP